MNTNFILKIIVAAALFTGTVATLRAQDTPVVCPFGYAPGTGRALSPEQHAEHIAALQAKIRELQAQREANTITAEDRAWLEQIEQRGGYLRTGMPRGPRGQAVGPNAAQGLRDGAGPRRGLGLAATPGQGPRDGAALGGGRGLGQGPRDSAGLRRGQGPRDGTGRGPGRGLAQGPRNGTGPRAIQGLCPMAPEQRAP